MPERITRKMLEARINRINSYDNFNPKLSLETWNPGDGRRYALEVANRGIRLCTASSPREVWLFLDGLTWSLWDWKRLRKD